MMTAMIRVRANTFSMSSLSPPSGSTRMTFQRWAGTITLPPAIVSFCPSFPVPPFPVGDALAVVVGQGEELLGHQEIVPVLAIILRTGAGHDQKFAIVAEGHDVACDRMRSMCRQRHPRRESPAAVAGCRGLRVIEGS